LFTTIHPWSRSAKLLIRISVFGNTGSYLLLFAFLCIVKNSRDIILLAQSTTVSRVVQQIVIGIKSSVYIRSKGYHLIISLVILAIWNLFLHTVVVLVQKVIIFALVADHGVLSCDSSVAVLVQNFKSVLNDCIILNANRFVNYVQNLVEAKNKIHVAGCALGVR
jgi:hypothetical protein